MSSKSLPFQTQTHGKWILAGEHAVVRGHGALVFPLLDKTLDLNYIPNSTFPLHCTAHMVDIDPQITQTLLYQIVEHGLQKIQRSVATTPGHLHIDSTIPIGGGMGASAALCVAITRWFISQHWVSQDSEFQMARELEHFFHGKSSGLDIIGVRSDTGMYFQNGEATPLHASWIPRWQLSFCGQQGPTADSIQTVQKLWADNPARGQMIDETMQAAVLAAKQALENPFHQHSHNHLAQALQQARTCFENWGLITPDLQQHMESLCAQGAAAVKPTGSGGGGYVISLW